MTSSADEHTLLGLNCIVNFSNFFKCKKPFLTSDLRVNQLQFGKNFLALGTHFGTLVQPFNQTKMATAAEIFQIMAKRAILSLRLAPFHSWFSRTFIKIDSFLRTWLKSGLFSRTVITANILKTCYSYDFSPFSVIVFRLFNICEISFVLFSSLATSSPFWEISNSHSWKLISGQNCESTRKLTAESQHGFRSWSQH